MGTALPPLSWERASPEGYTGIQLSHKTAEQALKYDFSFFFLFFFPELTSQVK